ncbi:MAG: hypothetical protein Q9219_004885 [cf. Caloplaca sp. 3 TL-2023]
MQPWKTQWLPITLLTTLISPSPSTATLQYRRPAPPNAQQILNIQTAANLTTNVIPGGSPFFYLNDPTHDLLSLASISMTPTPCQIGFPCALSASGTFTQDLPTIDLSFDIQARRKTGQSAQILAVRDKLCDWATIDQAGGRRSGGCAARKGAATIKTSMDLARGWIMEATYFIDLKLTSGDRVLTHVGAQITLVDHNPNPPRPGGGDVATL